MISRTTADEILAILIEELTDDQTRKLLARLSKVKGNASFANTMKLLAERFR